MSVLLWLLACGSPPTLSSVDPPEALAGAPLKLLGSDIPADATVWLVQGDTVIQVADAAVRGPVLVEGTVPVELPAGTWTVELRTGDTVVALPEALAVRAPEPETPCAGKWKANTQLALARQLVVIDRFHEDGERETLRIPIPEIEQLEYELVKLDDAEPPTLCSTIWVRRKDGTRVSFDDDTRLNLEPRAYKLGNAMKKPTKTTRKDIDEDPRPVEDN